MFSWRSYLQGCFCLYFMWYFIPNISIKARCIWRKDKFQIKKCWSWSHRKIGDTTKLHWRLDIGCPLVTLMGPSDKGWSPKWRVGSPDIGVNISERKSGTEPTKKRKNRELVFFPTARDAPYAARTGLKSQVHKQAKHTRFYKQIHDTIRMMVILYYEITSFRIIDVLGWNDYVADFAERISFVEHWKLVAESSEFHLTLSRAHRAHFFPTRNTQKSWTF